MWFASAKPPYGTLDAAEWAPSTASKADSCGAMGMSALGGLSELLPRTQLVERSQCRLDLLTLLGFRINVVKPVHQCGIFGTQFWSQFSQFLRQLIDRFAVFLIVGLLDLLTEFDHIAIGLSLGFVAADDSDDLLRVTLGHRRRALLLSLSAYRHGADHQNDNHRPHANTGPDNEVLKFVPEPRGLLR